MREHEIQKKLIDVGVPTSLKGFDYSVAAISLILEDPTYKHQIVKRLYKDIAKKFNTTSSKVERAIRHAIERTWTVGKTDMLNSMFGNTIGYDKSNPTNSEFLTLLTIAMDNNLIK